MFLFFFFFFLYIDVCVIYAFCTKLTSLHKKKSSIWLFFLVLKWDFYILLCYREYDVPHVVGLYVSQTAPLCRAVAVAAVFVHH